MSANSLCREAIDLLDDALAKPATELKTEVDDAERVVAALRDELIDRLRAAPDAEVRKRLDQVNVVVSLVVGLEYPVGAIERPKLRQASDVLKQTLAAGLPS